MSLSRQRVDRQRNPVPHYIPGDTGGWRSAEATDLVPHWGRQMTREIQKREAMFEDGLLLTLRISANWNLTGPWIGIAVAKSRSRQLSGNEWLLSQRS